MNNIKETEGVMSFDGEWFSNEEARAKHENEVSARFEKSLELHTVWELKHPSTNTRAVLIYIQSEATVHALEKFAVEYLRAKYNTRVLSWITNDDIGGYKLIETDYNYSYVDAKNFANSTLTIPVDFGGFPPVS